MEARVSAEFLVQESEVRVPVVLPDPETSWWGSTSEHKTFPRTLCRQESSETAQLCI